MTPAARRIAPLAAACSVLCVLSAYVTWRASVVVDGTRYFWLDDDQMITMRYARNVASGVGAVWNPGERVEGYTNPAWMAVMTLVHAAGVSDAKTALVVKLINLALGCAVLALSARLLRVLAAPREVPSAVNVGFLLVLATSQHVLFWCFNGFETTALTALFLVALIDALEARARIPGLVALAMLPLVRGDALHAWAAVALVYLVRSPRRVLPIVATLVPALAHVAWRRWYYGEWLPNTYYLKVDQLDHVASRGLAYLSRFAIALGVPLAVAAWVDIRAKGRQRLVAYLPIATAALYAARVGGDVYEGLRFFAHVVPLALALGVSAAVRLEDEVARETAAIACCVATFLVGGVHGPQSLRDLVSENGRPPYAVLVGLAIDRNSAPGAVIAVHTAGIVPYFARRRAIDVLGKCDAHIAHLRAFPGEPIGHGKRDPEYVFAREPDLFVGLLPRDLLVSPSAATGLANPGLRYAFAYFAHPTFLEQYAPNGLTIPAASSIIRGPGDPSIFARTGSSEQPRLARWVLPRLE